MASAAKRRRERADWLERTKAATSSGGGLVGGGGGGAKPPFCPMLSQYVAIGSSPIEIPGMGAANQIRMELIKSPCVLGRDCMLWDEEAGICGLRSMLEMTADLFSELLSEEVADAQQIPGGEEQGALPAGDSAEAGPQPGAP